MLGSDVSSNDVLQISRTDASLICLHVTTEGLSPQYAMGQVANRIVHTSVHSSRVARDDSCTIFSSDAKPLKEKG